MGIVFYQFQPDPKDYATEEEHDKAWKRWHEFKTNTDREFWHRILDDIDALKEQKEKDTENTGKRTRETSKKTKEKSKNTSRDSSKGEPIP